MTATGESGASGWSPGADGEGERVLVDSSLWVEYYQPSGRDAVQAAVQEALAEDRVATMAMIQIEVQRGALDDETFDAIGQDMTALRWLDVTREVASRAAAIGFDLERRGKRVPATDLLIAATAIEHRCTLWHDDGHFEVVAEHGALAQRRFAREHTRRA